MFRTPLPAEKSFDLTAADIFDELHKTHHALLRGSNHMQFGSVRLRVGLKRRHTKDGNVYEAVSYTHLTTKGVITDIDGNFTLNVQPGATIVVSFIGYQPQEIDVYKRQPIQQRVMT